MQLVQQKLLVIEDSTLAAMATQDRFVREFPFLAGLRPQVLSAPCRRCNGANAGHRLAYLDAKAALAGMGQAQKRKLKEMLNARQVRITCRNSHGRGVTQFTF